MRIVITSKSSDGKKCKFKLAPIGCRDSNDEIGDPTLSVDNQMTPFNFDKRKLFQTIRKPTED